MKRRKEYLFTINLLSLFALPIRSFLGRTIEMCGLIKTIDCTLFPRAVIVIAYPRNLMIPTTPRLRGTRQIEAETTNYLLYFPISLAMMRYTHRFSYGTVS